MAYLRITPELAKHLLPPGPVVHTYAGFIGADWDRVSVLDLLQDAERIELAEGPADSYPAAMRHPIAVLRPNGRWLHLEGSFHE